MTYRFELARLRFLFAVILCVAGSGMAALAQCTAPPNPIVAENCLAGNPSSEWDIDGAGDLSIQGFATDISANVGGTVVFKINTNASSYSINIYRVGYYGGLGARKVATIQPSAHLPQTQPPCLSDASTQLIDCGNWAVSASWTIPANATSGVYFAHITRGDTGGDSHIVFIVRNDASHSNILFQTADETWQAYNNYGGNSLYGGPDTFNLPARAYKVSYNRPFTTRGFNNEAASWIFGMEYPMIRWLESNGYDVAYFTGIDAARSGSLITNHKVYLSVGHDEYWSGPHRASVQAALASGVNMAFFSGNEVFWKTRLENSIDGTNTPNRTLVCYKETLAGTNSGGVMDPADPPAWTGTWRDPRFSPPADGGQPENALTGNLFTVNGPGDDNNGTLTIKVPAADGAMRFWRNTAIGAQAPGATHTLPMGSLGYEWDEDIDNGSRPAGAFHLSTSTYTLTTDRLLDYGAVYGAGTATHHLMMYRAPSGALVFGAGTVQWSWGLDSTHDNPFFEPNTAADPNMQQATVNLFADMGVQPATLQPGLVPATKSTDSTPPASTITSPSSGSTVNTGSLVTISGTATDSGGGVVGGIEISVDGGQTWHPAAGRGNWTYSWVPTVVGSVTIKSRAVDDSGNLETPASGYFLTVAPQNCPCDVWSPSNPSAVPTNADGGDANSIEVGVKFTTDTSGYVTGIRFYKSSTNTGTHTGNLWSASGALLATATFTNETGSGWQQVTFSNPVSIAAGTIYVASYFTPSGHYSADSGYFASSGVDDPPLHLPANTVSPNGVFSYGPSSLFPTSSFGAANYWVDVVFTPSTIQVSPASLSFSSQLVGTTSSSQTLTVSNTGKTALTISSITITGTNSSDFAQTNNCGTSLGSGSNCTIAVTFTPSGTGVRGATVAISDNGPVSPQLVSVTGTGIVPQPPPGSCPCSMWNQSVTPTSVDSADGTGIELGVKFSSDQNGFITGIRFFKSAANTGTHIGNLWTTTGVQLATVTFTNEGISGWQQVNFSSPVQVTANTTYIASYYTPVGHYSADGGYFGTALSAPPLHGVADGVSSNGVYTYGPASSFPQSSYNSTNYWVDVIFTPSPMTVSPASLTFSSQLAGTSSTQPVTLSNTGSTAVSLTSITITGTNSGDFTQTGTCGASLAAGSNCTINVTYAPTVTGTSSAVLTVTDNAPGGPQTVSLSGTSIGPIASLSATALTFASQVVGTSSAAQAVILSNTGNGTLNLTGITTTGANAADFTQINTCGTSLAVGASCTISVTFTPTATGVRNASVMIADNAAGSPQAITLTGTGVATQPPPGACPCSLWSPTTTPATVDSGDGGGIEVGVKFTSDQGGFINGIRFYKSAANTGTHIGNLWTTAGTQLATVTFTNEGTSGWQQMNFSSPVPIAANTTYIASYYAPAGHYSADSLAFSTSGVDTPPLHALSNSISADGVFSYAAVSSFPVSDFSASNYWVDVVFTPNPVSLSPSSLAFNSQIVGTASTAQAVTLSNSGTTTLNLAGITITGANSGDFTQTNTCGASLAVGTNCTISVTFIPIATGTRSANLTIADNATGSPQTVALTGTGLPSQTQPGVCPCTIWPATAAPVTADSGDASSVEVGVTFTSDQNGYVSGIRFYKSAANTGTHIGNLWTSAGVLLATATFTGESLTGWQEVDFSNPVPITANTTYVASYFAPNGHYSADGGYFASGVDTPPLHALANSVTPDGLFSYGAVSSFPQSSFNAGNYWVDVVMASTTVNLSPNSLSFSQGLGTASQPQVITLTNSGIAALSVTNISIVGTNSGDFAQTNTCSTSLAPGANCSISVTFTPSQAGAESAAVSIADNGANSPQAVTLTGTGVGPAANLAPTSLAFSSVTVGATSAAQAINLSNTGGAALNLTSIAITGSNSGDFAQTNTCGASLAAGANCSINATFTPTAAGARSAAVTITDNATGSPRTASLTGTGVVLTASLAPASLTFSSTLVGVTSAAQAITLSNTGTGTLNLTSITITGTNGGDFAQTNTCGASLAAGANCSISVTFKPTATGARSAVVTVTDNATGSPQTASLAGTGVAPVASLAPTSRAFSNTLVGVTSAAQTITLSNTGSATLNLTSIAITGTNSGDFAQTNNCGASVAAGANCSISVTFKPTATGARSATVTVTDNASGSPQTAGLTGTGVAPAASLAPTSRAFPNTVVGVTSAAQTITLSNTGSATLNLTSITITGTNSGDFTQTNTCGASVAAGANCSISVTFKPTANGARSASVRVTDNATGSPQTAALTGTGLGPVASRAPASLTFASTLVGSTTAAQNITLSNTGGAAMSLTSIAITGTNSGDFAQTNTCGTTLAAGANCSINVTFKPTAPGARSAAVSITDNAPGSPQTAAITGTGVGPKVTFSPTSITFGVVPLGTTTAGSTINLTNTGNSTLNLTSIAITGSNTADFSQTNTCGASLAAGSTCPITVKFSPQATGARTASVSVSDNAGGSPQSVSLSGTGTGASVSPTALNFGSRTVGTTSAAQTVTLRNIGTGTMIVSSISISGTNRTDFSETNTCGVSLGAGASCSISVTFRPLARGARSASLSISDSDPTSPQTVTLSGTGQ